ncbi:MAG: NAD(P)H-dependent glycerol-3-phosphate dehydrogenase [Pseudomonadota bacterium]
MIGVYGAGAFGTALAISIATKGEQVILGGRDADALQVMQKDRVNAKRLPDCVFPRTLRAVSDHAELNEADVILLVTPAQALRDALRTLNPKTKIILCAKGIEQSTGLLQSQIAAEFIDPDNIFVLSGPGFAREIATARPTALSIAGTDQTALLDLQNRLSSKTLRLYSNVDPLGVQLGGALKNIYAIACGLVIGADLGESARAAVMTRSFAEMTRFAKSVGADPQTLFGLSGFGDLVLTCSTEKSRNFAHGLALARDGLFEPDHTVEGIATTHAVAAMADAQQVDLPICQMLAHFLKGQKSFEDIQAQLLARPLKEEQS